MKKNIINAVDTTPVAELIRFYNEKNPESPLSKKTKRQDAVDAVRKLLEAEAEAEAPVQKKPRVKKAQPRRDFIAKLIEQGTMDRATVVAKTLQHFPDTTESAIVTEITDGKNPKYNRFEKPVVEDKETKLLSFAA